MSVALSDEKNELINNVAKSEGFVDYQIEVKSGSMKGDGYLGIINTVCIQDTNKPEKKLHLIVKSAMTEEKLRENAPVRKAYEREIFMYETIFPEFRKLSKETGITNRFIETAKCYGSLFTEKEECIVLENLKEIDFKLWNRKLPMNSEHVALVFSTYAKLHATGLVFRILQPEKYEAFSKKLVNIFYKEDETDSDKKRFEESVKHVFGNGFNAVAHNEEATKALTRFAQTCDQFFREDVRQVDKYCTILHGDCWCNNMMFRYKDYANPSVPTEMCLLDWQISHIGSPILDLSYFFYACSSKDVLHDIKTFLRIYHNSLIKTLEEAGLNPQEIFTYEELEEQWKIYSRYGLFMTLFVMKVILSEVDEAPDLSELAKEGKDILTSITGSDSVNLEAINKRISDVIEFMVDFAYL